MSDKRPATGAPNLVDSESIGSSIDAPCTGSQQSFLNFLNQSPYFGTKQIKLTTAQADTIFPFKAKRILCSNGVFERIQMNLPFGFVRLAKPETSPRHGYLWVIKGKVSLLMSGRSVTQTLRKGNIAIFSPSIGFTIVSEENTELLFIDTSVSHFEAQCGWKAAPQRVLVLKGETNLQRCLANGFIFVNDQLNRLSPQQSEDLIDVLLCLSHGVVKEYLYELHPAIKDQENSYKFEAMRAMHSLACRPDFSVQMVADSLGISQRYLLMIYRKSNDTPAKHALRIRMQVAADLLSQRKNADMSIEMIAKKTGYRTTAHFSRSFKGFYGLSPREYRTKKLS